MEKDVKEITATISAESSGYVRVLTTYDDDTAEKKTLPLMSYCHLLWQAVEDSRDTLKVGRIGKLPSGFVDGGYNTELQAMEAIIYVPGGTRPVMYYGKTFFVPFPDMIFKFRSQKGKVNLSQAFAVLADPRTSKNPVKLYHYPFGNVYSDGKICWGRNTLPEINGMKEFDFLISIFFGAETNDDLYKGVKVEHEGKPTELDQRSLFELLRKQKDKGFPEQLLVPVAGDVRLVTDL